MYNETDIHRVQLKSKEYAREIKNWHRLGSVYFKALMVFVVLDLFMIAMPVEFGRNFMLVYVILTSLLLVGHVVCIINTKRLHAKRIVAEAYIAAHFHDYKNINNPPKENN